MEVAESPRQSKIVGYLVEKGAVNVKTGISNSELCRELSFTKSACSQVLKKLEAKGLITGLHREGDRLRTYWYLVGLKRDKSWNKEKVTKNKGVAVEVIQDNG